jgi:hypothetical protein
VNPLNFLKYFLVEKYRSRLLMQELPGNVQPPWNNLKVTLHTANPVGAEDMKEILSAIDRAPVSPSWAIDWMDAMLSDRSKLRAFLRLIGAKSILELNLRRFSVSSILFSR